MVQDLPARMQVYMPGNATLVWGSGGLVTRDRRLDVSVYIPGFGQELQLAVILATEREYSLNFPFAQLWTAEYRSSETCRKTLKMNCCV